MKDEIESVSQRTAALVQAAEAGSSSAAQQLGEQYREGVGVPQDYAQALHWYEVGAELGDAEAQNNLASMLLNGLGCPVDAVAACRWYEASAKQGLAVAQYNLGKRYMHGVGADPDDGQAFYWLRQAAQQGYTYAVCELGTLYRFGRGTDRDVLQAAEYHIRAAEAGDRVAQGNLGDEEAELAQLALGGNRQAAFALCRIYSGGFGVDKQPAAAWAWLRWAHDGCSPMQERVDPWDINSGVIDAMRFYRTCLNSKTRADGERFLAERLTAFGRPPEGEPRTVLQVTHAEGCLTLGGSWRPSGWRFTIETEGNSPESETEQVSSDEFFVIETWRGALKVMDRYSWHLSLPLAMHPDFGPRIWEAWRRRSKAGGKHEEAWARLCGRKVERDALRDKPTDNQLNLQCRVRGCLLGGAIGDALGAPVEFMSFAQIKERFGPMGIVDYAPAYGRIGAITDDTQMTLFTAEGLLRGFIRERLKGICSVPSVISHAYLRWLLTQGIPSASSGPEISKDGWLWGVKALHSRRAPGNTCLSALAAMDHFTEEPARNDSKGAGAIMRVAPVALIVDRADEEAAEMVFNLAKPVSWITHGHPSGYLSAAAFAVIIHALLWGHSLVTGIERARRLLKQEPNSAETLDAMDRALDCVESRRPPELAIPLIGTAWVGEEALGVALFCALTSDDFATAVRMAVNHDGDSDTTGLLVGQLIGAMQGENALPARWLRDLELHDTIVEIADDLSTFLNWELDLDEEPAGFTDRIWERYPGW